MSVMDKLQEHAATIMAHLEDASLAAMEIQSQDKNLTDITHGFEAIRAELITVERLLLKADVLTISLKSK